MAQQPLVVVPEQQSDEVNQIIQMPVSRPFVHTVASTGLAIVGGVTWQMINKDVLHDPLSLYSPAFSPLIDGAAIMLALGATYAAWRFLFKHPKPNAVAISNGALMGGMTAALISFLASSALYNSFNDALAPSILISLTAGITGALLQSWGQYKFDTKNRHSGFSSTFTLPIFSGALAGVLVQSMTYHLLSPGAASFTYGGTIAAVATLTFAAWRYLSGMRTDLTSSFYGLSMGIIGTALLNYLAGPAMATFFGSVYAPWIITSIGGAISNTASQFLAHYNADRAQYNADENNRDTPKRLIHSFFPTLITGTLGGILLQSTTAHILRPISDIGTNVLYGAAISYASIFTFVGWQYLSRKMANTNPIGPTLGAAYSTFTAITATTLVDRLAVPAMNVYFGNNFPGFCLTAATAALTTGLLSTFFPSKKAEPEADANKKYSADFRAPLFASLTGTLTGALTQTATNFLPMANIGVTYLYGAPVAAATTLTFAAWQYLTGKTTSVRAAGYGFLMGFGVTALINQLFSFADPISGYFISAGVGAATNAVTQYWAQNRIATRPADNKVGFFGHAQSILTPLATGITAGALIQNPFQPVMDDALKDIPTIPPNSTPEPGTMTDPSHFFAGLGLSAVQGLATSTITALTFAMWWHITGKTPSKAAIGVGILLGTLTEAFVDSIAGPSMGSTARFLVSNAAGAGMTLFAQKTVQTIVDHRDPRNNYMELT